MMTVQGEIGILKRAKLPKHLQECIKRWNHYLDGKYGKYIDLPSEYACDYSLLTMANLKEWHADQKRRPEYKDLTFEEFIEQWGLQFEVWLVENCQAQLAGLTEILIEME
jgi:hypothetical protein